jgi:hypothetical protein
MLRFSPEWQVAFLRKAEPRAARPKTCPTSNASRLSLAPAVKAHRWHALSHGGASESLISSELLRPRDAPTIC